MKINKFSEKPSDSQDRIKAKPIICYPNTNIEEKNLNILHTARKHLVKKYEIIVPPREAKTLIAATTLEVLNISRNFKAGF